MQDVCVSRYIICFGIFLPWPVCDKRAEAKFWQMQLLPKLRSLELERLRNEINHQTELWKSCIIWLPLTRPSQWRSWKLCCWCQIRVTQTQSSVNSPPLGHVLIWQLVGEGALQVKGGRGRFEIQRSLRARIAYATCLPLVLCKLHNIHNFQSEQRTCVVN